MIQQELDGFKVPVVVRVVNGRAEFIAGRKGKIMIARRVLNQIYSTSSVGHVECKRNFYRSSGRDYETIYVD